MLLGAWGREKACKAEVGVFSCCGWRLVARLIHHRLSSPVCTQPTTKKSKPRAPVYEEEEQQQQYEEEEDDRVDSRRWPAREDVDEELDDIEDDEDDRSPPPSKKGGLGRLFKFWKR